MTVNFKISEKACEYYSYVMINRRSNLYVGKHVCFCFHCIRGIQGLNLTCQFGSGKHTLHTEIKIRGVSPGLIHQYGEGKAQNFLEAFCYAIVTGRTLGGSRMLLNSQIWKNIKLFSAGRLGRCFYLVWSPVVFLPTSAISQ